VPPATCPRCSKDWPANSAACLTCGYRASSGLIGWLKPAFELISPYLLVSVLVFVGGTIAGMTAGFVSIEGMAKFVEFMLGGIDPYRKPSYLSLFFKLFTSNVGACFLLIGLSGFSAWAGRAVLAIAGSTIGFVFPLALYLKKPLLILAVSS
jgi:hypothetical protein